MKYRNRLSGEEREDLSEILLAGLWQAQGEDPSAFIQPKHYALPQDAQRGLLPGELESSSIRLIGNHLSQLSGDDNTWLDWSEVSPLVPDISEQAEMQVLEQFLLSEKSLHLHHLQQVCARPHTQLQTEVERVRVSRARRADKKAAAYLAAHTEDWEKRTLWGVQPRHILAKVRYEEWNIYENRVAARLIDHLLLYLNQRIHALQKILDTLAKLAGYEVSGYHSLRDRLYKLWGEAYKDNQAKDYANDTLENLQNLKYLLLGLMGSVLYKQVPRRAQVADQLTMTNILLDDPCYRSVGLLWLEWARHGAVKPKTARELYQDYQNLCQGFVRFCLLLTVRAFEQLKYEPIDDKNWETPLDGTKQLFLQGWHGQVSLQIQDTGMIQLVENLDGKAIIRLRILPVPAALACAAIQEKAYLELAGSLVKREEQPPLTLVLYPGEASDKLSRCLHSLPHENAGLFENFGMLPVSPWEIASVEHVARALRWALMSPFILAYPPKIELEKPLKLDSKVPEWLKKCEQGKEKIWAVVAPSYESKHWLQQQQKVPKKEIARLDEEIKQEHAKNRNSKKHNYLQNEHGIHQEKLEILSDFERKIMRARDYFQCLIKCPVCQRDNTSVPNVLTPRDKDAFFCKCPSCESKWGLRLCGHCGERYPVLQTSIDLSAVTDNSGWIDKHPGMDILAVPKLNQADSFSFVCPYCFE
ncbi:MAG: DUF2357 domain-containing protein [Gammaproteobacteria bacterium]|nr:DUF2357 domain-containing protein [Gammaproteobacteria bacterium]